MKNNKLFLTCFVFAVLVVGLAYSFIPHFVRYQTLQEAGETYVPLTYQADADTMNVHGPRYRDIIDGQLISGAVDTHEHKDGPMFWPILSATLLAPFFWSAGSVGGGIILSDFVFPILIFVSFFLVIHALTRNKFFSLFSSFLLLLFPQLTLLIPPSGMGELKALVFNFIPFYDSGVKPPLMYLRREAFIPGGPFFILSFYFIYQALSQETRKKLFITAAGIFYGLLFYLYFYFWVFLTIFLGLLFCFFLVSKKWNETKTVLCIGGIGLFVSVPFWINQAALMALLQYHELTARLGLEIGHGIRFFLWKTYLLFGFLATASVWIGYKIKKPIAGIFLSALSLAGIFALNPNVLTGFSTQSDHWATRVFLITNGVIFSALAYHVFLYVQERLPRNIRFSGRIFGAAALVLALLLLINVFEKGVAEARNEAESFTVSKEYMAAFIFLVTAAL